MMKEKKILLKATSDLAVFLWGKNYANLNKNKSLELQKSLLLNNMKKKIKLM